MPDMLKVAFDDLNILFFLVESRELYWCKG
jgi:hypothetical protein